MFVRALLTSLTVLTITVVPALAGLVIVPTYDSTITSDANALAIEAGIQAAINQIQSTFRDNITVPITFQEGGGLGSSSTTIFSVSYTTYRNSLLADSKSSDDASALSNSVPSQGTSPVDGQVNMWITTATLDAIGISHGAVPNYGTITLNTSIMNLSRGGPINGSFFDLQAVAMHEIDEVLGLGSGLNLPTSFPRQSRPEDLFRYSANGVRSYTTAAVSSYFSLDGGATNIVNFGDGTSGSDYGDWLSSPTVRIQDAFGTPGATSFSYSAETRALDVIGFDLAVPEPGSVLLTLAGAGLLGWRRRRR
jgi:hypothetical protein